MIGVTPGDEVKPCGQTVMTEGCQAVIDGVVAKVYVYTLPRWVERGMTGTSVVKVNIEAL